MKYDKRGQHPNSLRNLKPRRKGQPSLNPDGRAGKNRLREILFGPDWAAYVRQVERDTKMVDKVFRKRFGVTANEAYESLRKKR